MQITFSPSRSHMVHIETTNAFEAEAEFAVTELGDPVYVISVEDGQYVDAASARELSVFFEALADELEAE